MAKAATETVSIYGSDRDCWKEEDSYGFTYNGIDYGVGLAGTVQDPVRKIAELLFEKFSAVLGKTQAERAAAIADVDTIETWAASAANTTSAPPGAVIRGNDLYLKDQNGDYVQVTIETTAGTPALTLGSPGALPSES